MKRCLYLALVVAAALACYEVGALNAAAYHESRATAYHDATGGDW